MIMYFKEFSELDVAPETKEEEEFRKRSEKFNAENANKNEKLLFLRDAALERYLRRKYKREISKFNKIEYEGDYYSISEALSLLKMIGCSTQLKILNEIIKNKQNRIKKSEKNV